MRKKGCYAEGGTVDKFGLTVEGMRKAPVAPEPRAINPGSKATMRVTPRVSPEKYEGGIGVQDGLKARGYARGGMVNLKGLKPGKTTRIR